jgi:hypothetical protein
MPTLRQAAQDLLSLKRIAVAGVPRKGDVAANGIYKICMDAPLFLPGECGRRGGDSGKRAGSKGNTRKLPVDVL